MQLIVLPPIEKIIFEATFVPWPFVRILAQVPECDASELKAKSAGRESRRIETRLVGLEHTLAEMPTHRGEGQTGRMSARSSQRFKTVTLDV